MEPATEFVTAPNLQAISNAHRMACIPSLAAAMLLIGITPLSTMLFPQDADADLFCLIGPSPKTLSSLDGVADWWIVENRCGDGIKFWYQYRKSDGTLVEETGFVSGCGRSDFYVSHGSTPSITQTETPYSSNKICLGTVE